MDKLDLSGFFTTKAQAIDFSARISTIVEKIYHTEFNLDQLLLEQFGVQQKDRFITFLRNSSVPLDSRDAIKNFLTQVQEKVTSLATLTLTVAFEPDHKSLQSLSEWFLVNLNKQVLLEIQVNPALVAGATIAINGKFFDFSVRSKLKAVLDGVVSKEFHGNTL